MFITIAIANNSMACLFIICEFSQRVNNSFDGINEKLDQLKWYLFPRKYKRMLPLLMSFVQQPIALECYGSIFCCRELFKGVRSSNEIYQNHNSTEYTNISFFHRL